MQKIIIKNQKEMAQIARNFALSANGNEIIILKGTLGAGKSFFARNFIDEINLNKKENIPSPTFNIVLPYETKKGTVFHFDLYRIKTLDELDNIGFFDYLQNGICLIEWPEIIEKYLPANYISIEILLPENEGGEERIIISNNKFS